MADMTTADDGPHRGLPVSAAGEPLDAARAALILLHGRGASAADILSFAPALAQPGLAMLAPQAAGNAWYPNSFLAPIASNEPYLSGALATVDSLVERALAAGIPLERVALLGFSQGACLALEYAARHARRYGGLIGWTGGLIGPDDAPRDYPGRFESAPVFLGSSDQDPYVPQARIALTAETLRGMGADVTLRIYPDTAHTVNDDEIAFARGLLAALVT
ncbi:MAG TPA: alpha/beta hydrolase [Ktedonobacterales bacterium]